MKTGIAGLVLPGKAADTVTCFEAVSEAGGGLTVMRKNAVLFVQRANHNPI